MANKSIFTTSTPGRTPPPALAVNAAGGKAYALRAEHALAQFAATGTLNDTYYKTAEEQLTEVIALCDQCSPTYVGQVAIFARTQGQMKDMPALLCAYLAVRDVATLKRVFARVINNGKMIRNFVQIVRSGKLGRKSLGSAPRNLVRAWLAATSPEQLFRQSVGTSPSLGDVIKMVRPKPGDAERRALYGYLVGVDSESIAARGSAAQPWGWGYDSTMLPALVREYLAFAQAKRADPDAKLPLPKVSMEMLAGLPLGRLDWRQLALDATWSQLRQNINTFARHGVFESAAITRKLAAKLADRDEVLKAKVFPYQLMAAFTNTEGAPAEIRLALQDAMEIAVQSVPVIDGQVYVFPDVSGSMNQSVTGVRAGATSKVTCLHVAALVAAVFMRKNPRTEIIPFAERTRDIKLNPRDSIMTNATLLGKVPGGGTNCQAPLAELNRRGAKGDLLIYVSDNESWLDQGYRSTGTAREWSIFKARNPQAKLVCIDVVPNSTTQVTEDASVLNVGGFSDNVFETIARFVAGTEETKLPAEHWVGMIKQISLDTTDDA